MPETFSLSESAVAVLRFRVKGYRMKVTDSSLEAFHELAAAGIMEPVPGTDGNPEADYQFTEDGWARRQELLSEAEERIERERFEPPDPRNLSEAARELLRRRLAGDREVTDANRPLYRKLVAKRIMYPVSTWVGGAESVFRFTGAGWERRNQRAGITSMSGSLSPSMHWMARKRCQEPFNSADPPQPCHPLVRRPDQKALQ
jgi:hypothetical protein